MASTCSRLSTVQGPRHDHYFFATESHVADFDSRPLRLEGPGGELVWRADTHNLMNAFKKFDVAVVGNLRTHCAENSVTSTCGSMYVEAPVNKSINHTSDIFFSRVFFHDNNHDSDQAAPAGSPLLFFVAQSFNNRLNIRFILFRVT
jgi:hypothetical protein